MDNPKTLTTLGTQDMGRQLTLEKTEGVITNEQSKDTGNTGHTRHGTTINVRENRRSNHEWTIQRH